MYRLSWCSHCQQAIPRFIYWHFTAFQWPFTIVKQALVGLSYERPYLVLAPNLIMICIVVLCVIRRITLEN